MALTTNTILWRGTEKLTCTESACNKVFYTYVLGQIQARLHYVQTVHKKKETPVQNYDILLSTTMNGFYEYGSTFFLVLVERELQFFSIHTMIGINITAKG